MEIAFGIASFEDALWTSDTSMTSLVPSGVGQNLSVAARVDGQRGQTQAIFSYDLPSIHTMMPANKSPLTPTTWLLIMGENFFVQDTTVSSRLGGSTPESSEWVSDSSVGALSSAGSSGTRVIAISIRHSTELEGTLSQSVTYDRLQLLTPPQRLPTHTACNVSKNVSTPDFCTTSLTNSWATGHLGLTVKGSSFGSQFDVSLGVSLTHTNCELSKWIAITSAYCRIPAGLPRSCGVSLTVGQVSSSISNVLSYDSSGVSFLLTPRNAPTYQHMTSERQYVGLTGTQLGLIDQSLHSRIGITGTESTIWASETSIKCRLHASVGLTLRVRNNHRHKLPCPPTHTQMHLHTLSPPCLPTHPLTDKDAHTSTRTQK